MNYFFCYRCDSKIDKEDIMCCTCLDDTRGKNQHFWQIKYEYIKEDKE